MEKIVRIVIETKTFRCSYENIVKKPDRPEIKAPKEVPLLKLVDIYA